MPENASDIPVPAILEYLPYRKNDFTRVRDAPTQSYLAAHGYAVVRLDLRGTGDSEGVMLDEYLEQELQDGVDAIKWIAAQDWCDGNVGMVGISWGGFNGLQIAALRPSALKAVITHCSTDDRYADDVHYMGGCVLGEQLSWASNMFARNTLPPDPMNVGDQWRKMWLERLKGSGLWLKNWLEHQRRDQFWKHGSVCEDWSDIQIPVYAVSGWADGYPRSVFRLIENLQGPKKGLVGPWAHHYPHLGQPGPAIGFLQEQLRWWDHWLKGQSTGIMDEPMLRLYMQKSVPPKGWYRERPGRWVSEPCWPSPNITRTVFHLGSDRGLSLSHPTAHTKFTHKSPCNVGLASGKWCGYSKPGDAPLDQCRDDAGSLCFETAPLTEPLEIAGDANLTLELSVDRPVAQIAARLVDVAPDGSATRVSFGVLNLTHRDSHEFPEPLVPGKRYRVNIPMKHVAQQFAAEHIVRLAISTNYFPMIWPTPEPVTLTLYTQGSALELPLRALSSNDTEPVEFLEPAMGAQLDIEALEEPDSYYRIVGNAATGAFAIEIAGGDGVFRIVDSDLTLQKQSYETYRVQPDIPGSESGETRWELSMKRGDWSMSSITRTTLTSDQENFIIKAKIEVWEGEKLIHDDEWNDRIPRDLV